jgi:hypothetical protein
MKWRFFENDEHLEIAIIYIKATPPRRPISPPIQHSNWRSQQVPFSLQNISKSNHLSPSKKIYKNVKVVIIRRKGFEV